MSYRIGIFGGGRAAWAFGSTWRRLGWPVVGVALRPGSTSPIAELLHTPIRPSEELAETADLLLLAVSDRAIGEVAASIPETNAIIFHPSGALPSVRGGFSLHPFRALPPLGSPSDLRDSLLVFEGAHQDVAHAIAEAFPAQFAEIPAADKPRYHAAAVFGSNYVAVMLDIAAGLLRDIGLPEARIRPTLQALSASAVDNWVSNPGAPSRFTGPASRGDEEVIRRHIASLQESPELAEIYRLLAARIVAAAK